jgi:hypothetical protein
VLLALFFAAKFRYPGTAPIKLPASKCSADLWKHVYQPERLKVIEPCTAVEGRVALVHKAMDGDLHIGLEPDQKSVLNLINVTHADRQLVVEAVCDHPSLKNQAGPWCNGFTSTVIAPAVGDRVRVVGAYVTDTDNGWNEIHPVTRIEVLH